MLSLPRTQLPYLSFCPSFPQGPKDFSAANHGNEKNRTYLQKKKKFIPTSRGDRGDTDGF